MVRRAAGAHRARRWRPTLSLPGSWGAVLLVCVSLTPSLLPRSGVAQGVVSGISAAMGYGIGVAAAAAWRAIADHPPRTPQPRRGESCWSVPPSC